MKGILGRKVGMTEVFTTNGKLIPVTVIEVEPNVVSQIKTKEKDGYEYIKHKLMFEKQEKVILLCLNSRLEIIQEKLLFIGSGDASMLETKEVFQHTLRCGANRIILIHNHPSGNPAPSVEDELITQKIKEMADCLEIEFIDHLIVGKHCFYSFASKKIYQNKED